MLVQAMQAHSLYIIEALAYLEHNVAFKEKERTYPLRSFQKKKKGQTTIKKKIREFITHNRSLTLK